MFLNLSKAQSNVLFAGKHTTIPYRTYICLQGNETALKEAESAIRNDDPKAFVISYNKELWTFSLDEGGAPPSCPESFQLTETTKGMFVPSTIAPSSLTMAKQQTPSVYIALMLSIEAMIQEALKLDDHYVPFGDDLILPKTGELLHLDARLTPSGELLLQLYQEDTNWEIYSPKQGCKDVVLAPTLVKGVIEETDTNEVPENLPLHLEVLNCHCRVRLRAKKQWTKVKIGNETVLWPSELLFVNAKKPSSKVEWTADVLDSIFEATQSIRGQNEPPTAVPAPLAQVVRHEENKQIYPTPPEAPRRVDEAENFSWDTPGPNTGGWGELDEELFGGDEVTEADFNYFDDVAEAEVQEVKQVVEEVNNVEEVTKEVKQEAEEVKEVKEEIKEEVKEVKEEPQQETKEEFRENTPQPLPESDFKQFLVAPAKQNTFSVVEFNREAEQRLNDKYSAGGRFFVPEDDSDEEGSDSSESFKEPETKRQKTEDVSRSPETAQIDSKHVFQKWSAVFNHHDIPSNDNEVTAEYENAVQRLAEQIVWDNSCYKDILPQQKYFSPPSVRFSKVVEQIIGDACKRLSLVEFAKMCDQGAQIQPGVGPSAVTPVSRAGTPQLEGSSPDTKTAASNWGTPEAKNNTTWATPETKNPSTSPAPQGSIPSANSYANPPNAATTQRLVTPMYSFMRGDNLIKAQPPILRFWTTFGLTPRNGPKPLSLTLVYPQKSALGEAATCFLLNLKMCYEACGFGTVTLRGNEDSGVMATNYEKKRLDSVIDKTISDGGVILICNPSNDISGALDISKAAAGSMCPNSMIFTLPCSLYASSTALKSPSALFLATLCRNLYDHLTPTSSKRRRYGSAVQRQAPACVIAKPVPPFINFKLLANTPESVINEDSLLHVSYAVSSRWITCAWSDQWGELSKVKVFCLQSDSTGPLHTLEEVCTEIWETTLQLNCSTDVRSVAVAKLGQMEDDELAMWLRVSSVTRGRRITPFFLVVDKRPSMVITGTKGGGLTGGPAPAAPSVTGAASSGSAPMSTPFRDTDSPDIYNHVATPSVNEEKLDYDDLVIVDVHDEIHSVILNQRQPLAVHSTRLGLATGYLVKTSPQNPNQLLAFSMTFVNCPCVVMHVAMKHFLRQYRNLISLSATTGVCDPEYAIAPWHVEAVDKMMRLVDGL